jgi:hypothetical protein
MNKLQEWLCKALDSDNKFVLAVLTPFFLIGIIHYNYSVGKWRRKTRAEDAARLANMPKWEDRPEGAEFIGWCYNTKRYIWKKSDSNYYTILFSPPSKNGNWDW